MPPASVLLAQLSEITNTWRGIAIGWHVSAVIFVVALILGRRPSPRLVLRLLAVPVLCVSILAWLAGNPFNAAMFSALAVFLVLLGRTGSRASFELSAGWPRLIGTVMVVYALFYPHFLASSSWTQYLYAAPVGLIPCPTLALIVGVGFIVGLFRNRPWQVVVSVTGIFYGAVGVAKLGVHLDYGLLAGAIGLAIARNPTVTGARISVAA